MKHTIYTLLHSIDLLTFCKIQLKPEIKKGLLKHFRESIAELEFLRAEPEGIRALKDAYNKWADAEDKVEGWTFLGEEYSQEERELTVKALSYLWDLE